MITKSNIKPELFDFNKFKSYLQYMNAEETSVMLTLFPSDSYAVIRGPETGLIMSRVNDTFGIPFNLGEILVSTAEVEVGGERGHATVIGDEGTKAVLAAVVNAHSRDDSTKLSDNPSFMNRYKEAALRIDRKHEIERKMVSATKVNFQNMAQEEG